MLDHRGFSAWITSDDLELIEFEPRTNAQKHTVTCWIAGTLGKTFVVHWQDHGSDVDSASYIYFDGFKVSGQFLYGTGEELRSGLRVGSEEERPFIFSTVGDEPASTNGKPPDKNVGSIVLEIRLIKRVGEREPNPIRAPPNVVRGLRQSEDVAIRYGDVRPAPMQKRTFKIEPFDTKAPGPYVTFIFRYRSRDWLVSQGIIGDDDDITRELVHPPIESLSVADLPPIADTDEEKGENSDNEGAEDNRSPPGSPLILHSPAPAGSPSPPLPSSSSNPASGPSGLAALGLGHRPQAPTETSRVTSDNTIRSFSGTWDPTPTTDYEHEQWDEYRPEDLDDEINHYYR